MPIYEFYCKDCHTIFNFFSRRVNTEKQPDCPRCGSLLKRQMSTFSTIGRAKESGEEGMPDIDEARMERMLGELAQEAGQINEDDPRQMARMMRKLTEKSGLPLGEGMEEAIARLEAGEDPEKIEQEMGDLLEGEDPLALLGKKEKKGGRPTAPQRDETLYEL